MLALKYAISINEVDAILPQTQCQQCGYEGCRPYAEAIVAGEADINQCPPGGSNGIKKLANLLNIAPKPLNQSHGVTKPYLLALIDEQKCIGCTLCIQACPVDAIMGMAKHMHTVLTTECTGCELCLPPCPVDCITMVLPKNIYIPSLQKNLLSYLTGIYHYQKKKKAFANKAREQHQYRALRLAKIAEEKVKRLAEKEEKGIFTKQTQEDNLNTDAARLSTVSLNSSAEEKKAVIAAAIARAKARKAAMKKPSSTNEDTQQ